MRPIGPVMRRLYVGAARFMRRIAASLGLLAFLERRYQKNRRSFFGHLRTMFAIHDIDDLVHLDTPWWTYPAIAAVESHLASIEGRARVFEFGSGASTVWLGRRSGEVISVEHHAGFASIVRKVIDDAGLAYRVQIVEMAAEVSPEPAASSRRRGEDGLDYTAYAKSIEAVGGVFDLVVVDGRARIACLQAALPYLASGGIILLDDAQRPRYKDGMKASRLSVHNNWGWVPSLPYPRDTALLGPSR